MRFRKIGIFILMVFMLVSSVFGANGNAAVSLSGQQQNQGVFVLPNDNNTQMMQIGKGLMVAYERVNEQARQRIQANIQKMSQLSQDRLDRLENIKFKEINETGEIEVRGSENSKFLGFIEVKRERKFTVTPEGELIRNRKILDFLFTEEDNNGGEEI